MKKSKPMMIFISCAKTMTANSKLKVPSTSLPVFMKEAGQTALEIAQLSAEELGKLLKINSKLAAENYFRYQNFFSEDPKDGLPALLSYTGMVFKRIHAQDFTEEDFNYAQQHLFISSFLYGLLRPLDLIRNYRLEGEVRLPGKENQSLFDYWKPLLTDYFIETIQRNGGVLINLASAEMKQLFDWEKVCHEVNVVTPEFQVYKNGELKTIVVYAKMCRGEMTRFLLKNRIGEIDELQAFEWEGFTYNKTLSSSTHPVFTL